MYKQKTHKTLCTCGKACITVSSRALIPVAIFKSFSTVGQKHREIHIQKTHPLVKDHTFLYGLGEKQEAKKLQYL